MTAIPVSRIQELLEYDKDNGIITQKAIKLKTRRRMLPDPETGTIIVYDPVKCLRRRMLYRNLAYVLGSGAEIPEGKKVLCHDLNEQNIKYRNLKLVDKAVYRDVLIAIRNLETDMKIVQHPKDKHAYLLVWNEYRAARQAVYYDFGEAQEAERQKELELVKFINQHIVSN
jgi:hypothetical protein